MDLGKLEHQALESIAKAKDVAALEAVRVEYLGREHGKLTEVLRSLKNRPLAERKKLGPAANALKGKLEGALKARRGALEKAPTERQFDVTKPGKRAARGHLHPLTRIDAEVRRIFASMNFSVVEGPEVETEYHNFDALNIPPDHPARDLWDTFWIKGNGTKRGDPKLLLRTHTSPMQIRYMLSHNPPFQIIVPGRVFRYEPTDASHEINFYQVEGLMVGPDVSLSNLKFVVEEFLRRLLGNNVEFRFRPSYFPFVEPGVEVDIRFKGDRWLEVMGAGMVHRNVFDAVRYNPETMQGFAFGVGLDRLAMIKYHVPDIRLFYSGDVRFVRQF